MKIIIVNAFDEFLSLANVQINEEKCHAIAELAIKRATFLNE